MLTSNEIKAYFYQHGADLCGIASMDRFGGAPEGFHPRDVLPDVRSVIAVARRFPVGTLRCESTVPYTIARNMLCDLLDKIVFQFCCDMEMQGIVAMPTGTCDPTEYDVRTGRHRNIISAKHAAQAAGLGVIGRNTLLITPEYGNMVWLSAILCELELEPDPLLTTDFCKGCNLCVNACPAHAVGDPELKQNECRQYAFGSENGGEWKIKCYRCRDVCPHCLGERNRPMAPPRRRPCAE
ncbi:MAG: 4Fe-4S binding protein [Eubacteriales bacterium]|nr:4Fe-4S binding protein [Eubacteriales bacterium]